VAQQGILALHTARSLLVKQQTMLANAMRGLAAEFGLTVSKGIRKLEELQQLVDADGQEFGNRIAPAPRPWEQLRSPWRTDFDWRLAYGATGAITRLAFSVAEWVT
jgi:transposase